MYEYTERIREFVNETRRQHVLLKNRDLWSQLCSCLDVLGDSQLAIDAYSTVEFGKSDGANYLALYGLLQALFLQQDAVINLCESLKIPETIDNYPRLKEIREIRNDSIGHPTKRNRRKDKSTSYHFILQPSLCSNSFKLLSCYSDGKNEFKDITISNFIADQKEYISKILESIITKLEYDEKAHKEKFRMEKLVSIFPSHLQYDLSKLREGTRKNERAPQGDIAVLSIRRTLQNFQQALAKRGIELETYDSIKYLYKELEYPLCELEEFFQCVINEKEPKNNEKAAYIFADFVTRKIEELIQIADEIDKDYSS
jgi:hypothetical protein